MFSELRFVLRTLARSRGFTAITVLTLALGIGSAGSIFSVADWALFRANKFPEDVLAIGGQSAEQSFFNPFRPSFIVEAYEQRGDAFAEFAKGRQQQGNIVVEGRPVGTVWTELSANALGMFGTRLQLGRSFLPGEDTAGSDQVVILSDWFWRQTFLGDENIVGRRIIVGDAICTIVGVLAEGQRLPGYLGGPLVRPLVYKPDPAEPWRSNVHFFGRLQPGVTREQALAALRATTFIEPPQFKGAYTQRERVALMELGETGRASSMTTYWLMLGAVAFLYAIACLNASNLMLVRMLGQRRDLCVRLAMGAGRGRVIRLLVMESVVLAVGGGLLGVLVTNWLFPLLLSATGNPGFGLASWASWRVGWRVVGVLAALSVLTSAFITLLPVLRVLRTDINSGLKDGGGALGESPGLARLRGGLVVLQAAFAVVLLTGAGLMIRTFQQFQKVDLGFEPAGLHKVMLQFPSDAPRDWQPRLLKLREIEAILREIPGVRNAGFGTDALLPGYRFEASKFPGPGGKEVGATIGGFNPGFREAVGLKLKAGHWFTQERGEEVVVNESFARAMWPDQDPIGKVLMPVGATGNKEWIGWTVIGVVGDLRATMREGPGNHLYRAEGMEPQQFTTFIVRTAQDRDPAAMEAMRRRIYAYDQRIIVHQIATLTELRDQQLSLERMANSVLQVLAGIALLLTLVGTFSVLAYTVDRRLGEFGVRLALGASARDLVLLVARRGLALTSLGVGLGLGGALGVTRFLKALLFETTADDPWVLAGVAMLLLVAAGLACVMPARRAARVDVAKLLRSE